jgi:hypothetical protein
MATETHKLSVGNTLTPVGCECVQRGTNGVLGPTNLTGLSVKFTMVDSSGTVVVNEATATVNDAANGLVQYDFQSGDVDTAGTFYGWFNVYSGSEFDTYPVGGRKLVIEITARA